MTTYNTRNPLGSQDPRDLFDNAQNMDHAANSLAADEWSDRFGKPRKTWRGIEKKAELDIAQAVLEATTEAGSYRDQAQVASDRAIAAASAIGPIKFYDTYAQAVNDLPNRQEEDLVEVAQDENLDGTRTRYRVKSGALSFCILLGTALSGSNIEPTDNSWIDTPEIVGGGARKDINAQATALTQRTNVVRSVSHMPPHVFGGIPEAIAVDDAIEIDVGNTPVVGALYVGSEFKKIRGKGVGASILNKVFSGAALIYAAYKGFRISNLTLSLNGGGSNAGHGVYASEDSAVIDNVSVTGIGNRSDSSGGGIGVLVSKGDITKKIYASRLTDCSFFGSFGTSGKSFGWIFDNVQYGFASHIYAENIVGTELAISHELKNYASLNNLHALTAKRAVIGLGYGQETPDEKGVSYTIATGVLTTETDIGYNVSEGAQNILVGFSHNDSGSPGISEKTGVYLRNGAQRNAIFAFGAYGTSQHTSVRYGTGAINNFTQVAALGNSASVLVNAENSTNRNVTEVAHAGGSDSIASRITGTAGTDVNPVYCHGTGERFGSLGGRFHDFSGTVHSFPLWGTGHRWRYESTSNVVHAMGTNGLSGNIVGFVHAVPDNAERGGIFHQLGVVPANDILAIRGFGEGSAYQFRSTDLRAVNDGSKSLGSGSARWSQGFGVNGWSATSDARLKSEPRVMTQAEVDAFLEIAELPCIWQWLAKIETEGSAARLHAGPTVQAVVEILARYGLNPFAYAAIEHTTWEAHPEQKDESGVVLIPGQEAGDVYSFKRDELQYMLWQAHRIDTDRRIRKIESDIHY